jgi:hypothetical protein
MPDETTVSNRKIEHLRINLEENVQFFDVSTGLEKYRFIHQALPEIALDEIDTTLTLFGKTLRAPILVSSMTGGAAEAERINRNLAIAAQEARIAMGLGSQRAAISDAALARTYQVRDVAPDILLFANLGAIQLNYGYGIDECRRAVDMVNADALILHLNPIQEAVQDHGNTNWRGLLKKIENVCRTLDKPVIVKEVGFGISENTAHGEFQPRIVWCKRAAPRRTFPFSRAAEFATVLKLQNVLHLARHSLVSPRPCSSSQTFPQKPQSMECTRSLHNYASPCLASAHQISTHYVTHRTCKKFKQTK